VDNVYLEEIHTTF